MTDDRAKMVLIRDLTPWAKNPRKNDPAVDAVADSIRRFGFASPILARVEDGRVIAGHTRLKAAIKLGMEAVPVRYLDLDDDAANALALADNKLGELAEWDDAALAEILSGLGDGAKGLGWDDDEIAALLAEADPAPDPEDDAPEVREEAVSQLGEVYQLGPHRLACGSSSDPEVWARLLGEERLQMVWTDPPYGVAYVGGDRNPTAPTYQSGGKIENDDLSATDLRQLLTDTLGMTLAHTHPGAVWYVAAPSGPLFLEFGTVLQAFDVWRHTLAWVKNAAVFGRCDYHYRHESLFYGWTPGAAHLAPTDHTLTSVLEHDRPGPSDKAHPTMKPLSLVRDCIRNSSRPGWIIGEPFCGSGTTLLAAAAESRVCRAIELDPRYCDVIRRRWAKYAKENDLEVGDGLE